MGLDYSTRTGFITGEFDVPKVSSESPGLDFDFPSTVVSNPSVNRVEYVDESGDASGGSDGTGAGGTSVLKIVDVRCIVGRELVSGDDAEVPVDDDGKITANYAYLKVSHPVSSGVAGDVEVSVDFEGGSNTIDVTYIKLYDFDDDGVKLDYRLTPVVPLYE